MVEVDAQIIYLDFGMISLQKFMNFQKNVLW